MNTTSQADLELASGYGMEDLRRGEKGLSLRSRLVVLSMILTLLFVALPGMSGVGVQDVEASHTTVNVNSCFVYSNGVAASGFTLKLYKWTGSSWILYRSGKTGSNGCGTFYGVPGQQACYFVAMRQVYTNLGYCTENQIWQAKTPYKWAPTYGTGYVLPLVPRCRYLLIGNSGSLPG